MTHPALRTVGRGLAAVGSVTIAALVLIAIFVSPQSAAVRNQRRVVSLLVRAAPDSASAGGEAIQRVLLGDGVSLVPQKEQVDAGYVLKLEVRSAAFSIKARPVIPGKTGLFAFFRDEDGVIRVETNLGRPADVRSRPWPISR
jgi:hypothetical protein